VLGGGGVGEIPNPQSPIPAYGVTLE
jgi:hypothetical protein